MFSRLLQRKRPDPAAQAIYAAIVQRSREAVFYRDLGVPDSLDGRFELLALHTILVLNRLKRTGEAGEALAQNIFDTFFADMDVNLREMGAGDMGVGKRVKAMAQGFYGRAAAYEDGLVGGDEALKDALSRNVYGTTEATDAHLTTLVEYVKKSVEAIGKTEEKVIHSGQIQFGSLP